MGKAKEFEESREILDVFNEAGRIIGKAARNECHKRKLIHRCVRIFVFGRNGEILLNKRSRAKDKYPGQWEAAIGGHVRAGGKLKDTAKREMLEELGIACTLKPFGLIKYRERDQKENSYVFWCAIGRRKLRLKRDEIEKVEFVPVSELKTLARRRAFTPYIRYDLLLLDKLEERSRI